MTNMLDYMGEDCICNWIDMIVLFTFTVIWNSDKNVWVLVQFKQYLNYHKDGSIKCMLVTSLN